jgi:hypothetical protein
MRYIQTLQSTELEACFHEDFISSGEILPSEYIAETVAEFEKENACVLSPEDIHRALWNAKDSFVDSMQGNVQDGYNYEGRHRETETEYEEELARYEAMRPAKVRQAEVQAMVENKTVSAIKWFIDWNLEHALERQRDNMDMVKSGEITRKHHKQADEKLAEVKRFFNAIA